MRIVHVGAATLVAVLAYAPHAFADGTETTGRNELPPEEAKVAKPQGIIVPVSIMGGLRFGGALEAGKNAPDAGNHPNDAIAAIDLALELGCTVFDHFYGGLIFGGDFFISPQSTTASISSLLFGTELGYLTNPSGLGGYFGLGAAYRAIFVTDALGTANKFDGADLLVTVGLHVKLGQYLRLIPRADLSLGPTTGVVHAIFIFGLSVWFNDQVWPTSKHHL